MRRLLTLLTITLIAVCPPFGGHTVARATALRGP